MLRHQRSLAAECERRLTSVVCVPSCSVDVAVVCRPALPKKKKNSIADRISIGRALFKLLWRSCPVPVTCSGNKWQSKVFSFVSAALKRSIFGLFGKEVESSLRLRSGVTGFFSPRVAVGRPWECLCHQNSTRSRKKSLKLNFCSFAEWNTKPNKVAKHLNILVAVGGATRFQRSTANYFVSSEISERIRCCFLSEIFLEIVWKKKLFRNSDATWGASRVFHWNLREKNIFFGGKWKSRFWTNEQPVTNKRPTISAIFSLFF